MNRRTLTEFLPLEYVSSGIESVENTQIMAEGSKNALITGMGKPTAFKGMSLQSGKSGSRYLSQAGDKYAGLGAFGDASGKGSVLRVMAGLFYSGIGTVFYDGVSLSATASSILQLKLLVSGVWGTTYQAGLSQPSAPTIATRTTLGTGFTGKLKSGTYSVKIYKIRTATGARSNASPVSNFAVAVESNSIGQSLRVTFPAADQNGGDRWGVCVTPRNFGTTGPYFLLQEIAEADIRRTLSGNVTVNNTDNTLDCPTGAFSAADIGRYISITNGVTTLETTIASINSATSVELTDPATFTTTTATAVISMSTLDGVPFSYEIEWTDGDLVGKPLAPVESSPPPACVFAGALGNSVFVDGCYGDTQSGVSATAPGTVIACSLPLRPEEFPGDWLAFPPDAPTALLRGGDGYYYRFGANSLGVIAYTGGDPPITYQLLWGTTGISYAHNAVVAEGGRLYAKTGSKGLVRIGANAEFESLWATPILDDIEGWNDADTVLGWDENSSNVVIMNNLTALPFNSTLEKWGAPIDLTGLVTGKVLSAATYLGSLYISCLNTAGSAITLYRFNVGSGTVMEIHTDWHFAEAETDYIRRIKVKGRFDATNNVTLKVFKNLDKTTPVLNVTLTPTIGSPVELPDFAGLIPDLKSFCVSVSQTNAGGDMGFEMITVEGFSKGVAR